MSGFVVDFGVPNAGESDQTATGTTQATAFVLTKKVTVFSSVPSGSGAVLPSSCAPGASLTVCNRDAANSLNLYPASGDQIEAGSVDAPVAVPIGGNVTLVSFAPVLSPAPRVWYQTESYSLGGYLPLAGGTIAGPLSVTGTVSGAGFTARFASPGPIGSTSSSTGAFTTLSASSTVSGAGFDAYLALGTKPASFTTLAASSTVSGAGFDAYLALGTKPASFTTLAASGLVSGAGFTARFASPGAIGSTVASTGAFTTLSASGALTGAQRGFLSGLKTSRSSATVLAVSAGECADSTNAVDIQLAAFTKSTAGTWAAGSGGNGMGSGLTIANTTWYHVFAIINAGTADVYFDTSASAANKPASTTAFRRIGSFLTNGSAQIIAYVQNGDRFDWGTPVAELTGSTPGVTTAMTQTLSAAPLGVVTQAILSGTVVDATTANSGIYVSSLAQADVVANGGSAITAQIGGVAGANTLASFSGFRVITNTSAQVRFRVNSTTMVVNLQTNGWIDTRGQDS